MPQTPAISDLDRCKECKGKCCSYFCLQIDTPKEYDEFEDVRWYLCHENVNVHIDEDGDWYMQVLNRCQFLDENYACTIYNDRPLLCRKYTDETCEDTVHGYGYQKEFHTPEELDAYVVETLGREEYEQEMVRQRAKHEEVSTEEMTQRLHSLGKLKLIRPKTPNPKGTS
ncbi:MAG: YkgJ family cysteine cluster protein [Phycisphaerales bacterium]|jgi:uncharacterized protein|nr:YkgJ family cysteine cluster protein [Phycisphaerales bacterium]MBT7170801.1 YkgJ family cysteine cluster protein [Phycisphaerales bacterium]